MLLDDPALVDPVDVYPGVNGDGVMRICAVPPVPTSGARPRKIERYHLTAQLQRLGPETLYLSLNQIPTF